MKKLLEYKKLIFYCVILLLIVVALFNIKIEFLKTNSATTEKLEPIEGQSFAEGLPNDTVFDTVAENDKLILKFDDSFGHFQVHDKRNGNVYYSYPEPEDWVEGEVSGAWNDHIRSPLMFQYGNLDGARTRAVQTSFISEGGFIVDQKLIEDGIQFTFELQNLGFSIPVQLRIEDDYVETTIVDSEIVETDLSLVWLRLYPSFGAEKSNEDGYLFIPDGSGALIPYVPNSTNQSRVYHETIYGIDYAFDQDGTRWSRPNVPVYGMRTDDKGFVAVVHKGDEFSEIYASPSGVYTNFNWSTAQMRYRDTYFQVTNEKTGSGFITYNKDDPFLTNRIVRYYLLEQDKTDYVGMAERYRQHLMETKDLTKIENEDDTIPLHISFLGGSQEKGTLRDRYIQATTTSEAMQMVQQLYGLGVQKMEITYKGWQVDGYASYGGLLPVDSNIGGNEGMKQFVQFAHSLNFPVYLQASYFFNNSGGDGFIRRYHGARNLAGQIQSSGNIFNSFSEVSSQFALKTLSDDMDVYEALGVDGLRMDHVGTYLNSDYNTKYGGTREEVKRYQQQMFHDVKERLGSVQGMASNAYTFGAVDHIHYVSDDYSFDLFSKGRVPFLQIALHGLIPYSSNYANDREQFRANFLRDIEYGALPAYIFTHATADELIGAYDVYYNNPNFDVWVDEAVKEYQRFNEVFGELQDLFIIGHRTVSDGVNETIYENGTRIIVNYNKNPYIAEDVHVPAEDFIVIEGGE